MPLDRASLTALMEVHPDATLRVDPGGRILQASAVAERLFRAPPGGLAGRVVEELVPDRFRARHESHRTAYAAAPSVREMSGRTDLAARRLDGSEFEASISLAPIALDSGPHVFCLVRDLTTQSAHERALRLRAVLARALVQTGDFEDALASILEDTAAAIGWHAGEVWVPHGESGELRCAGVWSRPGDAAMESWMRRTREIRFGRGQGLPGRVWASGQAEWILDLSRSDEATFLRLQEARSAGLRGAVAVPVGSAERVVAVLAFFKTTAAIHDEAAVRLLSDVAEQLAPYVEHRRSRDEAIKAGRLAQGVVDTVHEPLLVLDTDWIIRAANPAFGAVFAAEAGALLGRGFFEIGGGAWDRPEIRSALDPVRERGHRLTGREVEITWPGSGRRHVSLNARRIERSGQFTPFLLLAMDDLSERRRLEEQLRATRSGSTRSGGWPSGLRTTSTTCSCRSRAT